jgi:hypothetical protein
MKAIVYMMKATGMMCSQRWVFMRVESSRNPARSNLISDLRSAVDWVRVTRGGAELPSPPSSQPLPGARIRGGRIPATMGSAQCVEEFRNIVGLVCGKILQGDVMDEKQLRVLDTVKKLQSVNLLELSSLSDIEGQELQGIIDKLEEGNLVRVNRRGNGIQYVTARESAFRVPSASI